MSGDLHFLFHAFPQSIFIKAMFTLYRIVKRSVAESVPDRASVHTIVPQLSKCLKFEAIWGNRMTKGFVFKHRDITRPVRILLFRE